MTDKPRKPPGPFRILTTTIRENAAEAVKNLPPGEGYIVKIISEKETRSKAQHRLKWVWMKQIEKELAGWGRGYSDKQWNDYFKGMMLMPILIRQDEAYVEYFQKYSAYWQHVPDDQKDDVLLIFGAAIQTEWLNTKGMTEFLDCIDKYAAEKGVGLITPEEFKWARECKRNSLNR